MIKLQNEEIMVFLSLSMFDCTSFVRFFLSSSSLRENLSICPGNVGPCIKPPPQSSAVPHPQPKALASSIRKPAINKEKQASAFQNSFHFFSSPIKTFVKQSKRKNENVKMQLTAH